MIKILFICHGNICRSPMAEFCLKDLVLKSKFPFEIYIASAATSTEEIRNGVGNPVYPPAKSELASHGISCAGKTAVQLTKADYDKYDYLIGMDDFNLRNMGRITGGDPDGKFYKMMEFADDGWEAVLENRRNGNRIADVADPWYTGDFRATWQDVLNGCEGFLKYLLKAESLKA